MLGPRALPRLELTEGVSTDLRTLVVVPTLFGTVAESRSASPGSRSTTSPIPTGTSASRSCPTGSTQRPRRHPTTTPCWPPRRPGSSGSTLATATAPGGGARFLLFHRKRRWNEGEGRWMGWERKRGKLHELNALLRGSTTTDILVTGAAATVPPAGIRYVVTLDADTRLPRGAVDRLVGTIAHPLNRASFDAASGRVTRGYGILQPQDHVDAPGRARGDHLPACLLGRGGDRPLRLGRLGRLPGPLRRGELHRQGDLRRRRLRGGAGRSRPGERPPQPRPVRGHLRPRRPGHRHRAVRRVPVPLPRGRRPPAPLGAGRLAAPAVDPRPRARCPGPAPPAHPGDRALEDDRQPAPDGVSAARRRHPRRGLAGPDRFLPSRGPGWSSRRSCCPS